MRRLVLVVLVLGLAGCAAGARTDQMIVSLDGGETPFAGSPLVGQIDVGPIGGGRETNPLWMSDVGNEEFRSALVASLQEFGLVSLGIGRYELTATLQDLNRPLIGASLTVTSTVLYRLERRVDGRTVFQSTIVTPYTGGFADSLLGTERLRLANEGAIRANIQEFLNQLATAPIS